MAFVSNYCLRYSFSLLRKSYKFHVIQDKLEKTFISNAIKRKAHKLQLLISFEIIRMINIWIGFILQFFFISSVLQSTGSHECQEIHLNRNKLDFN